MAKNTVLCRDRHPDGWYCLLPVGHDQGSPDSADHDHFSLDNRHEHGGFPGAPVRWSSAKTRPGVVTQDHLNPTLTAHELGKYVHHTGASCEQCGSVNTIPDGTCTKCLDCFYAGSCGG